MKKVNVLIPTYKRPLGLAITLTSLYYQTFKDFDIIIADQNKNLDIAEEPSIRALVRALAIHSNKVKIYKNLPRKGMAQQRQFLLEKSYSPHILFIDDDVILESFVIEGLYKAIKKEKCGFAGKAVIGLSFINDLRPNQQKIEFWEGKVIPEIITPKSEKWKRHLLHNAANLYHVEKKLGLKPENQRLYKIAWVGGCVMYDKKKLQDVGGFSFWQKLPAQHTGEDVLAQLRIMKKYGGCAIIPSGVYHQELPTTLKNRRLNAPEIFL